MVGLEGIPVERVGQGAPLDLESDEIGPVWRGFGVNGEAVGD